MSAYLSNLLTQTTSRYNSLRRTLLSNEEDGDTEDDSHISRVLRAYYLEKGRPFPPWLPPDPKDRRAQQPALSQQPSYMQAPAGGYYGNRQVAGVQHQSSASNRSSLSDLWDPPAAQPQSHTQLTSLRAARPSAQGPQQPLSYQQQQQQQQYAGAQGGHSGPHSGGMLGPRPLPSQRAGSYQSVSSQHSSRSGGGEGLSSQGAMGGQGGAGGGTAQERLKARLWGAGRGPGTPPPQGANRP